MTAPAAAGPPAFDLTRLSPAPQRILAVKLSAMGDVIHATPCLRALRQAFPAADIRLAVEARWADVVRHNPHIDGLIESPPADRLSIPYLWHVRSLLSQSVVAPGSSRTVLASGPQPVVASGFSRTFDVAIDLQGLRRSAAWVYSSGARVKAGRGARRPGWAAAITPDLSRHAVRVCADTIERLGVPVLSLDPEIVTDAQDDQALDAVLRARGLPSSGFVVVNPFSRWLSKDWPETEAAVVTARIARDLRAIVIVSGGSEERARGAALARRIGRGDVVSLAGALTLGQALCLYRRARVMVSCDSGPMHAAAALGTPVVALFGPTLPERTGPWGPAHRVIQASRPDHHHAYRTADGLRHMQALDPDAVFEAIRDAVRAPAPVPI